MSLFQKLCPAPFPSVTIGSPSEPPSALLASPGSLQTVDGSGRFLHFTQADSGRTSGQEREGTHLRVGLRILMESIRTLQWPHPSLTPLLGPNQAVTDEDNRVTDSVFDARS